MKGSSWESQCVFTANNIHGHYGNSQYGGTATMIFNELTLTISGTGYNKTGLGRWSWAKLSRKDRVTTRIVTAYCPNLGSLNQPSTVYAQQKRYFLSKNIDCCPREKFRSDLSSFITSCTNQNEQIILCIDLNEDTTKKMDRYIRHCYMKTT